MKKSKKKAVVLLSGGMDSAVTLYWSIARGYEPYCLIFDYGQAHSRELRAAVRIARKAGASWRRARISLPWKGSSLLDRKAAIPENREKEIGERIPSTYVPSRNLIFLSFALSWAETLGACAVMIGANAVDYSGYPDCRPAFIRDFERTARSGSTIIRRAGAFRVIAPLIKKSKKEIIYAGSELGVPFGLTWSCYRGGRRPCLRCDACKLRARGFRLAGMEDPALARGER